MGCGASSAQSGGKIHQPRNAPAIKQQQQVPDPRVSQAVIQQQQVQEFFTKIAYIRDPIGDLLPSNR